jgi:hypothetical protein
MDERQTLKLCIWIIGSVVMSMFVLSAFAMP